VNGTELKITTLAERPELVGPLWAMKDAWPEFMLQDPVGWLIAGFVDDMPEYTLVATDARGELVARAFSVPFALHRDGRGELPPRGWDQVLLWASSDRRHGLAPDTVSAIEITVARDQRGRGLSGRMLAALRHNAADRGFDEVVAPVRPNAKHLEPETAMDAYAHRVREDGLPHDPWLRVHVRAGARIASIAPASMTIGGSLAQWRAWTGMAFDTPGPVLVDGALAPVHCAPDRDHAVYVEPNVWVRHAL
jgi:GNAT superfamily N-acetyltransferase